MSGGIEGFNAFDWDDEREDMSGFAIDDIDDDDIVCAEGDFGQFTVAAGSGAIFLADRQVKLVLGVVVAAHVQYVVVSAQEGGIVVHGGVVRDKFRVFQGAGNATEVFYRLVGGAQVDLRADL